MNKMVAVIKREYLQAVRRKMFMFMTVFFPVLIAALFLLPGLLISKGLGDKKVAVIDGTGDLRGAFLHRLAPEVPDPKKALAGGGRRDQLPRPLAGETSDALGQHPLTTTTKPP